MPDVDTVVIGSGAGGLAAALALARTGERVLVLEQHELPGGWCHTFRLDGHAFSPGVHYIGGLNEGGRLREVYEGLGVAHRMEFLELDPQGFDRVHVGGREFAIPRGKEVFRDRLKAAFPAEARGIDGYFGAIDQMVRELEATARTKPGLAMLALPWNARHLLWHGFPTLATFQSRFLRDPTLKAVLAAQAGDHGLGPDQVPAIVHAVVQHHYYDGAWFPKGGGGAIPRAFCRELVAHHGEVQLRARVERILVEGGAALGVRLEDGTEVSASRVISNADPGVTWGKLVPPEHVPPAVREKLAATKWSVSCLSLFLVVDMDLAALGLGSANHWWYQDADLAGIYASAERALELEEVPGFFLTVTTLKDRTKERHGLHTLECFVFVDWESFQRWAHTRFGERPEDYAELKRVLSERMLRGIERLIPGIRDHVVLSELGTPLTNRHYVAATHGGLHGTAKTLRQLGPGAWPIRAPLPGLYQCGASTTSHGVAGATLSGLQAAAVARGCRTRELLTATNSRLVTRPADP